MPPGPRRLSSEPRTRSLLTDKDRPVRSPRVKEDAMRTSRLEAFSDGVLAIIITIMVLELKVPGEPHTFDNLLGITGPGLLTYLLSFIYVGIYWNNHHHM